MFAERPEKTSTRVIRAFVGAFAFIGFCAVIAILIKTAAMNIVCR